jgi:hypothetical protein
MPVNDLAGGVDIVASYTPEQLYAGDAPIKTNNGVAAAAIQKYQLIAVLADASVTPFVAGTHNVGQAAIAAQPIASGKSGPYFSAGCFNHAVIVWPAGATFDSFAKRKGAFVNCPLTFDMITTSVSAT